MGAGGSARCARTHARADVGEYARGQTPGYHGRTTLERLSASLSLAFDALLLDEEERYGRERERMLATALTTMDQPVFILDRRVVRYANPAAVREYGWSLSELIGRSLDEIVIGHTETSGEMEAAMNVPGLVHDLGVKLKHRRRDGSEFPAAMTQNAITADDGTQVGQVVSVRNMTARARSGRADATHRKNGGVGRTRGWRGARINNPLTGISAFAQLLLEEKLEPEQREAVQMIKRESDRATTVIRDLLLFSRKEGAAAGPVDINALLEQTVRLRAYQLRNANVEVTLLLDPGQSARAGRPAETAAGAVERDRQRRTCDGSEIQCAIVAPFRA